MLSLESYWYRSNKLVWLLLPLSWLYCLITVIRRKLYQLKLKKSFTADTGVVIVGNIVTGGSGKTPLLIALCELIKAKGYTAGIVSRGYGGAFSGVKQVAADDPASLVGDEPLMIHQRTGLPVVVSADRVAAVNYLLANNACDIVLSDDGMQHYRMSRDIELVVVDSERLFGNGLCLPAGPLREKVSRLDDANLTIYNGKTDRSDCFYQLKRVRIQRLNGTECLDISDFIGREIHAVAAIGNPERFFRQLEASELTINRHAFSDHHQYQQEDFSGWSTNCIIMTEKDAVKCNQLSLSDAWVVIVSCELSEPLQTSLEALLLPLLVNK